ncbi:MAG: carboxypeptidase regulatory-like domain-containing protein, partial [Acidimicrobiia bacterium]|nr:carboxypeptidase regulatory-like domain-containing protein [Acidimicrobiia bacterium]
SVDYDGGADGSAVAVVLSGATTSGVDFGHRGTGTVGDTVWLDEDEDGSVGEFEEPIAGADVTLTWWGFDGDQGTGDDYTLPVRITDENGYYRYQSLPPGSYTLTVDTSGITIGLDPTTPTTVLVVLAAGASNMTGDFGFAVEAELPFTGLAADHLLLASALMIGLGALVFADTRKRERKFKIALGRIE